MTMIYSNEADIVQDHVQTIIDRELDIIILKMGSLLSILQNKKTNQAKLLITLVKDLKFRNWFLTIAEIENFQCLVQNLIDKYPTLCKSRVVSGALKRGNKSRKAHI